MFCRLRHEGKLALRHEVKLFTSQVCKQRKNPSAIYTIIVPRSVATYTTRCSSKLYVWKKYLNEIQGLGTIDQEILSLASKSPAMRYYRSRNDEEIFKSCDPESTPPPRRNVLKRRRKNLLSEILHQETLGSADQNPALGQSKPPLGPPANSFLVLECISQESEKVPNLAKRSLSQNSAGLSTFQYQKEKYKQIPGDQNLNYWQP